MAKLYFYYASMNAGKSSTLLQAAFNYAERGMRAMLWTAAFDDRYGAGQITSRIGLKAPAHLFEPQTDIFAAVALDLASAPLDCVLIDEAQFLTKAQVFQCARICDELSLRPLTTKQLCQVFPELDRCTVMLHLGVLERAGLVVAVKKGRERFNYLDAMPIQAIHERWIAPHAAQAAEGLLRLKRHLEPPEKQKQSAS